MKYLWFTVCLTLFCLYLAWPTGGSLVSDRRVVIVAMAIFVLAASLIDTPGTAYMDETPKRPVQWQTPPPVREKDMVPGMY